MRARMPDFRWRPFTLADGLAQSADNFLLLRALAALAVIYGHGYAVVAEAGPPEVFLWLGWGVYSGTIAVDVFFLVSGFLVTGSFLRRPRIADFLVARAARVIPAYATCVLACAFVLGALVTTLPLSEYLADARTRGYAATNLRFDLALAWTLPGVFVDNPRVAVVNGSLWTLPIEVRLYLLAALAGVLGIFGRRALFNALLLVAAAGLLFFSSDPFVQRHDAFFRMAAFFALGSACYVNRSVVPASGILAIVAAIVAWLLRATPLYTVAFALAETCFVFWFAYRTRWRSFNRCGDYSYGLYLWGYPVQQVLAQHFPAATPLCNAAASLPLALVLSIASWHAIEKPGLRLKALPQMWREHLREKRSTVESDA